MGFEQLKKGENLFHKVVYPLAKISDGWRHVGLVCCPEVESRDMLREAGLSLEEAEVSLI